MLSKVHSGAVYGVDAYPVEIEVNSGSGDPQTVIVGLPDAAVKESPSTGSGSSTRTGFTPRCQFGLPRRPRFGSGTTTSPGKWPLGCRRGWPLIPRA